jgi:Clostripain family
MLSALPLLRALPRCLFFGTTLAAALSISACSDESSGGDPQGGTGNAGGGGNVAGGSNGAGGDSEGGGQSEVPDLGQLGDKPAPEAAWTFLVYGHGDHNLSNSLLTDLQEMARAELGEPGTINVLALTDWDASQAIAGTDPPQAFPEGVQLFRVPGGGAELELLAEGPEANLDDSAVLTELVGTVFQAYPAKRRAVVLWDHGGAWSGGFGSDTQNGTETSPTAMPAEAIPPALMAGLKAAGVKASPPLDIVAFDTCLMAGAEIVYPFRDVSRVYIANAEIDYGPGWDFTATLTHLARNADDDAVDVAKAEVGYWQKHHAKASANDALLRSHVALDLSAVPELAAATQALTTALQESTTFPAAELGRAGFYALPPYASQFESGGSSLPGLRDFGQVLDSLAATETDAAVASAASAARQALEALVLARSQGSIREASGQGGLHVEMSLASQLGPNLLASYAQRASQWSKASGWQGLLGALADASDAEPPAFEHLVSNADGASAAAPPVLQLTTVDADTAKGAVYLGRAIDDQTIALLGLIGSGLLEPASDYTFAWDGTVATFPDGQPAMLDIWLDVGAGDAEPVLMAPGVLSVGGEQLETALVFTPSEGAASAAVVSLGEVSSTLSLGEILQSYPDATFTPLYVGIDVGTGEQGLLTGDPIPLPASGELAFSTEYVAAGTYLFFTSVTDVWGNSSTEPDAFQLAEPLGE